MHVVFLPLNHLDWKNKLRRSFTFMIGMRSRKMCANPTCKDKSNQKITSQNRSNPYTQKCRDPDPTYKNIQYGLHPLDMWGSEVNQTNLLVSTSCPWILPTTCSKSSSRHERVTGRESRSFMRCEASIEYQAISGHDSILAWHRDPQCIFGSMHATFLII
jgi:hypothetical protein